MVGTEIDEDRADGTEIKNVIGSVGTMIQAEHVDVSREGNSSQAVWFAFLGFTFYLWMLALATTHRMLLLDLPQTLPILQLKVELLPFYVIAPLLYLVAHFYILVTLAGPKPQAGINGLAIGQIAFMTVVIAPLATLILVQMMFLPYHSLAITWWHRALVLADLSLVIVIWRRYFHDSGIDNPLLLFRDRPQLTFRLALVAKLGAVAVVVWLSLWEGRWAGEDYIGRTDFLGPRAGVVFGLFPDRLMLGGETIVGEQRLEETKREMASRGGDFVPTIRLDGRDLQAAVLSGADLRGVSLFKAVLRGAKLSSARLDGANLTWSSLQVADLEDARLPAASLMGTQLQFADLSATMLAGANLSAVSFQGANLGGAQLVGATLEGAQLQGAFLRFAGLQGANLRSAVLRGANLEFANLWGADLRGAQFQGANLSAAQLQGANLSATEIGDGEFDGTFVFRADIGNANFSNSVIRSVRPDQIKLGDNNAAVTEPLAQAAVDRWKNIAVQAAAINAFVPDFQKAAVSERFARLAPNFQTNEQDASDQARWGELEQQSLASDPDDAKHRRRLAKILGDLVCQANSAPYLAIGLIRYNRLASLGDQLDVVRARMEEGRKNPEKCPGVVGFTEGEWRQLDLIKPTEEGARR